MSRHLFIDWQKMNTGFQRLKNWKFRFRSQAELNAGVSNHLLQAASRVQRIQWQVGLAGFQYRQYANNHFNTPGGADACNESMSIPAEDIFREGICLPVQFGIAQFIPFKVYSDGIRRLYLLNVKHILN